MVGRILGAAAAPGQVPHRTERNLPFRAAEGGFMLNAWGQSIAQARSLPYSSTATEMVKQ